MKFPERHVKFKRDGCNPVAKETFKEYNKEGVGGLCIFLL